ncbi:MAG: AmmeMemoRadiSam system radical SAM enzyme [Patescibacteria group bacterium]|nr:AmmeMemoRadiSam system radical SAM enzyme [Patescibacteria group bacterium]
MREAILYKKLANGAVKCEVCCHQCVIADKKRGICSVRENRNGVLYALNYGLAITSAVDPIEKKPFFHFFPGTTAFSFATLGCNFRCDNCQNWQISQGSKLGNNSIAGELLSPEIIVKQAQASNCSSVAYTYTEPTIFIEYALETMKLARRAGLKNVWVSNGFFSEASFIKILPYLDAINIDLKFFDDRKYQQYCGGRLQPILDNIVRSKKAGVWTEITTLAIPSLSDDDAMFQNIAKFIKEKVGADVPWHISVFAPEISYKLQEFNVTPVKTLERAASLAQKAGLKHVYAGNTPGNNLENTYCANCHTLLIKRLGYQIKRFDNHGVCYNCKTPIDIIE